jgi:hypothetical protein
MLTPRVESNNTVTKFSILRELFVLFDNDPIDLMFYLSCVVKEKVMDVNRFDLRKRFWAYALPVIQKANRDKCFGNCNPVTSNAIYGFFGISGCCLRCVVNLDEARVDFFLGKSIKEENKAAFDYLQGYKDEIEDSLLKKLTWNRENGKKASRISYSLKDVSLTNESDWPRIANFMGEWTSKFFEVILPILKEHYVKNDPEKLKKEIIFAITEKWARRKTEEGIIEIDFNHSNQSHIRFKTQKNVCCSTRSRGIKWLGDA